MTKTLVALYETVTTAEQVVHELIGDGFARSAIHLALDHTTSHALHNATGVQEAAYEGANLVETLAELGVPYDEAFAYAEGVRRGGALDDEGRAAQIAHDGGDERVDRLDGRHHFGDFGDGGGGAEQQGGECEERTLHREELDLEKPVIRCEMLFHYAFDV